MAPLSIIGKPLPMTDSPAKVTGFGKYADDLSVPGMLVGKILHSPHAHARIRSIQAAKALAMPEVKAVATGQDTRIPYGILPIGHDERALALDKVRYIGDNVAAAWIHDEKPNNIEKEYHHEFGDLAKGFAEAAFVREERYFAGEVNHAAMEPHATLALWEPDGRLTVHSSTQVPYYLHRTIAEVCEMPMSRIRVIKPLVGGGFS